MASSLNEVSAEKKFTNVTTAQDSIQTMALWMIHHKVHHEKVVDIWLKVLKKGKTSHRLSLFYVCNEVVQTCKKKHAIMYKDAFKSVLRDAVLLARDSGIRPNVERILKIWGERGVYDMEFIEDLQALMENAKPKVTMNSKLLAEFKPQKVSESINKFKQMEAELELKERQLSHLRMDASSLDAIRQLKDRSHGKEFTQQFEDACNKLEDYVAQCESHLLSRSVLIELLEKSEIFYDAQYAEAKIVTNAYKNFGTRVNNLKRKLNEHRKKIPSPVPSPTIDAPSPGNTPPDMIPGEATEAVDMDVDSDSEMTGNIVAATVPSMVKPVAPPAKALPLPITNLREIRDKIKKRKKEKEQQKKETDDLYTPNSDESAPSPVASPIMDLGGDHENVVAPPTGEHEPGSIFDMLHSIASGKRIFGNTDSTTHPTALHHTTSKHEEKTWNGKEESYPNLPEEGGSTPLKDEGGSTPVQDEKPDASISNPIDFLTQLITQSQKTSLGTSSSFQQGLTAITKTAKSQFDSPDVNDYGLADEAETTEEVAEPVTTPASWAAWKAQKEPEAVPPPVSTYEPISTVNSHTPMAVPPVPPLFKQSGSQPLTAVSQPPMHYPATSIAGSQATPTTPSQGSDYMYQTPTGHLRFNPILTPISQQPDYRPPPMALPQPPPIHTLPYPPPVSQQQVAPPPMTFPSGPPPFQSPPRMIPPPMPPSFVNTSINRMPAPVTSPPVNMPPWGPPPTRMNLSPRAPTPTSSPTAPPGPTQFIRNLSSEEVPRPPHLVSPPPHGRPKGILRNTFSNLTEIKTVSDSGPPEDHVNMPTQAIQTVGSTSDSSSFEFSSTGPKPPSHPPGPRSAGSASRSRSTLATDQEEFIEMLKKKSIQSGSNPPPRAPVVKSNSTVAEKTSSGKVDSSDEHSESGKSSSPVVVEKKPDIVKKSDSRSSRDSKSDNDDDARGHSLNSSQKHRSTEKDDAKSDSSRKIPSTVSRRSSETSRSESRSSRSDDHRERHHSDYYDDKSYYDESRQRDYYDHYKRSRDYNYYESRPSSRHYSSSSNRRY